MCSLVDDLILHSGHPIEDDRSGSTLNIVDRRLRERDSHREGDGELVDGVECLSHLGGCEWL